MAQERDAPVEELSPGAAEEIARRDRVKAGWDRPVHLGPRTDPVSVAFVREVAEELMARAVRLHQDALREHDRATRLLGGSGSPTGSAVDTSS